MRILSITHSYGADGAAVLLRTALHHWTHDLGWEVDALCGDARRHKYRRELAECGARPLQSVDASNYDVALVNTAVNAARLDSMPANGGPAVVLWMHEGLSVLSNSNEAISSWVRWFSRCSRVVFQTAWQRDEVFRSFTALMPPERLVVVPNGIEVVRDAAPEREQRETFRIVCVGSVYGRKRQGDLAKIVQKLAGEMPVECEFIGDLTHAGTLGPEFTALLAHPTPCLKWLGPLPHAETLERVARADLFCLPSMDESFPLAPLEAATRGVPVLISALPPYSHIGWKDGENCLQHGVGDLAMLEHQIRRIAAEPELHERIRRGGKKLADAYPVESFLRSFTDCVVAAGNQPA